MMLHISFTLIFHRIYHPLFYLFTPFEFYVVLEYTGSEIRRFTNGVCQGTVFKDIPAGRYYPCALPKEPNSYVVKFNFGPDFEFFPQDFGGLPIPRPMSEVPYQAAAVKRENVTAEKSS